jgi:hypothetical protein
VLNRICRYLMASDAWTPSVAVPVLYWTRPFERFGLICPRKLPNVLADLRIGLVRLPPPPPLFVNTSACFTLRPRRFPVGSTGDGARFEEPNRRVECRGTQVCM